MKKLYTFIFAAIFFAQFLVTPAHAYSWLYVFDPHTWGKSGQGTIDEAVITVEPKGIYAEYNVYLTFSAMGLNLAAEDSLEISYYFSLPKNSIVHDSWLWVDDSVVVSRLIDRWTAYSIYEGIVKRRRDPSVLYKDWQDNYQLRIYPLIGNGQRKVKISFLAPSDWSSRLVSYPIPLDLLTPSLIPTNPIRLLVKHNDQWQSPSLPGYPDILFAPARDKDFPDFLETVIPASYVNNQLKLAYSSPLKNGIYLSRFQTGNDEGLYQMAFLPSDVFDIHEKRKVLTLFDFETANNYQVDGNGVFAAFKTSTYNNLNSNDQFNMFFSAPDHIVKVSSGWLPADPSVMEMTFGQLGEEPVQDCSKIDILLKSAIRYIRENGNDGEILLLANSSQFGDNDKANALMAELNNMGTLPKITVIDFNQQWNQWFYIGGRYFRGNEYFYTMLTRQTKGNFYQYNYWESSVTDIVDKALSGMNGYLNSFDLHTKLEKGFCYGRFDINETGQSINLGKPILQIGKFRGQGDLIVEAAAVQNGDAVSKTSDFSEGFAADSLLLKVWAGCYIASMEETWSWDNQQVEEIISTSLKNRVLSTYTAFLALEPGIPYEVDDPGNNNSSTGTSISSETVFTSSLGDKTTATTLGKDQVAMIDIPYKVFPNPFYNRLHLQVGLPSIIDWKTVIAEVYDVSGQKVRIFSTGEFIYNGFLNIEWDGKSGAGTDLCPGVYYLVLRNDQFRKDIKVVKLM